MIHEESPRSDRRGRERREEPCCPWKSLSQISETGPSILFGVAESVQVVLLADHDQDIAFFDEVTGRGREIKCFLLH